MSEYIRRVTRTEEGWQPRLAFLDIELTERCNNSCIHCYINRPADDEDARSRELTTERVKAILSEAAELGSVQVRLTGGEPLLRPDFEEIYLHARGLGLCVSIYTNARLIDERIAAMLQRTPPLAPLEVSAYGMRRESYETVSGSAGSYDEFRRGVELLLERGIPFVVKSALLPANRDEVEEFEEWARTIPCMSEAPGFAMSFDLRARGDDPERDRRIKALRVDPHEVAAMAARDPERYRSEMASFREQFTSAPDDRLFPCSAGTGISVDAYGRAQPCLGLRAPDLSVDLSAASLEQVLGTFEALRDLRATDPSYLARCARCRLRNLCDQCPAKSWVEHGTLDTPVEYLCEVAHAQARWLGWLGESEFGWDAPAAETGRDTPPER